MKFQRQCAVCGTAFETDHNRKVTCGLPACRQELSARWFQRRREQHKRHFPGWSQVEIRKFKAALIELRQRQRVEKEALERFAVEGRAILNLLTSEPIQPETVAAFRQCVGE